LRRLAKWTGLVLSLVLIISWLVSFWFGGSLQWRSLHVTVHHGYFGLWFHNQYSDYPQPEGLEASAWQHRRIGFHFRQLKMGDTSYGTWMQIPHWVPLIACLIPTLILFYGDLRNRARAGHCQHCRYDLTGNTSGTCPECGTRITPVKGMPK
jgi:hypothetical protein